MAFSGSISGSTFNALKVVDHAYRRCRLPAQSITAEMQQVALENLYLLLSELATERVPSWCIEKIILPMYQNQPIVELPLGTVEVLNLNYRVLQAVTGASAFTSTSYTTNFTTATQVTTVGIRWAAASVPVTFEVSTDGVIWIEVGSSDASASAGEWTWTDISRPLPYEYFRISSTAPLLYVEVYLGNTPQEIPLGALNRDGYVNQSNKMFPGRPSNYWFQRNIPNARVNLWPAPFQAATYAQLILWRHRQIMDTQNLQQEVEIPQRWYNAIVDNLAARVAPETPMVDPNLYTRLDAKAANTLQIAWDGDTDGSPTYIQPSIGVYTA